MSGERRRGRPIALPVHWTSVRGVFLSGSGLTGNVLTDLDVIMAFEQRRVIEVDVRGWTMVEIIEALCTLRTPSFAKPELRHLCAADLEPLVAIGSLTRIDVLRLMSLVPGWQP